MSRMLLFDRNLALSYLSLKINRSTINPKVERREKEGQFHTLFPKLLKHPPSFYEYLRMPKEYFFKILRKIENSIRKMPVRYPYISPAERLVVTLRYVVQLRLNVCT